METHTASSLIHVHGIQSGSAHASGVFRSSLNAIKSVVGAIVRWQRQRHDILELQRMDDRLLADIGITRGEAEHMVRNGRWNQAAFEPEAFPATRPSVLIWDKEFGERA
jgi:uncharacterized protein YjiS (DUF1127 family)